MLLDVAAAKGVDWLEPGEGVFPEDLEAAAERQGVRVQEGDAVLLRTGYGKRKREIGREPLLETGFPGWHVACLPWLHERGAAVIGADTATDVNPSGYAGLQIPIHAVGIVHMGLWLIDNMQLEDVAEAANRFGLARGFSSCSVHCGSLVGLGVRRIRWRCFSRGLRRRLTRVVVAPQERPDPPLSLRDISPRRAGGEL